MKEFLNNKKGVSLIEIMLAVAVFVVSIVTVAHLFIGAQETSVFSMQKNEAISLAKEGLEAVRSIPYSDLKEEYGEFIEEDANSLVFHGTLDRVGNVEDVEVWFQWGVPGEDLVMEEVSETFENTSTGRSGDIQTWTVPADGTYTITAYGAQGGGSYGGLGAKIAGEFELGEGDILEILVGQEGQSNDPHGGGGGGTFVVKNGVFNSGSGNDSDIYVIAGGGGANGSRNETYEQDGRVTGSGGSGFQSGSGGTGSPGSNGSGGTGNSSAYGGAGFIGNGDGGAQSFINGGLGDSRTSDGGFGGGGGANTGWDRNAGGGGYSGGAGARGSTWSVAGGGGSYNNGTNQSNESGVREGHGLVIIEGEGWDLDAIEENLTETTPVMENPSSSFSQTVQLDPEEIPEEIYFYRVVGRNLENNNAYLGEVKVIETGITNFAVNTKSATSIDENSATIRGEILSMGIANSADVWFDYGTEETLGEGPVGQSNMNEKGEFSFNLTGLDKGVEYYFQAKGENAKGETDQGEIMSFTPYKQEVVITATQTVSTSKYYPDSNRYGRSAKLQGCSNNWTYQAHMDFDLSEIPAGAVVAKARLYLYHHPYDINDNWDSQRTDIARLLSSWDEQTITWNNAPSKSDGYTGWWQVPVNEGNWFSVGDEGDINTTGVRTMAQEWIDGTHSNYGMAFLIKYTGYWRRIYQLGSNDFTPYLEIEFE